MEIKANSFSLRGESGLVKIVSDSVFAQGSSAEAVEDEAECDIIVESDGFRVNKVATLKMSAVLAFLVDLKEVVRRGSGSAEFLSDEDELAIKFIVDGGARVECEMNDRIDGKENSVRVRYPVEPSYFEDLVSGLEAFREYSATNA